MTNLPHTPIEHALDFDMNAVIAVVEQIIPRDESERAALHEAFSGIVAECINTWRSRAIVPIRKIRVDPGEYEHPPEDLTRPELPNGYPVLVVSMNDSKIGIIGLKRQGGQYGAVLAAMPASRFMLETVN